jgi:hypothetical protein
LRRATVAVDGVAIVAFFIVANVTVTAAIGHRVTGVTSIAVIPSVRSTVVALLSLVEHTVSAIGAAGVAPSAIHDGTVAVTAIVVPHVVAVERRIIGV